MRGLCIRLCMKYDLSSILTHQILINQGVMSICPGCKARMDLYVYDRITPGLLKEVEKLVRCPQDCGIGN